MEWMKGGNPAVRLIGMAAVALVAAALWLTKSARSPGPGEIPDRGASPGPSLERAADPQFDRAYSRPVTGQRPPAGAPSRNEGRLSIHADFRSLAEEKAQGLADGMEAALAMVGESEYVSRSLDTGDPARMLALRLGLDAETAAEVEAVLAADRAAEVEHRMAAERERLGRERDLLASEREGYVDYLALEMMEGRGIPLTPEQRDHWEEYRLKLDVRPSGEGERKEWYERGDVVRGIEARLSPAEREAFGDFVAERIDRERERHEARAAMRSASIADRLGLSAVERELLEGFLRDHPEAGMEELSGLMAPELRDLLVPGM